MRIVIDLRQPAVPTVSDADDFKRFHVEAAAPRQDLPSLDRAFRAADAGQVEADKVLVSLSWLERTAAQDTDAWRDGFAAMISYATSKGWVDDAGHVRAHIEWCTDAADGTEA